MKTKKGFTLVELLVVIAIIGILSSIGLVALNGAREKARDAKKKSDLTQYRNVLLMNHDSNDDKYYATGQIECVDSSGISKIYNTSSNTYEADVGDNLFAIGGPVIPTYLATQLKPLKGNDEDSDHYCYDVNDDFDHYILFTKLEGGDKLWYWVNDLNEVGTSAIVHNKDGDNCSTDVCSW